MVLFYRRSMVSHQSNLLLLFMCQFDDSTCESSKYLYLYLLIKNNIIIQLQNRVSIFSRFIIRIEK